MVPTLPIIAPLRTPDIPILHTTLAPAVNAINIPADIHDAPAVTADGYDDHSNGIDTHKPGWRPEVCRILLICAGPNDRPDSLYNLLRNVPGLDCVNYDIANGAQFDIVDDTVWDRLLAEVSALEYVACLASPPCNTYSRLHSLPGPPPLRDVEGSGRYGRSDLSPRSKEHVRKHTLISTRVAHVLTQFTRPRVPWIFEAPWATEKQTSALNLDEYRSLLAMDGVTKTLGYQCPFGGLSPKPSAWVLSGIDFTGMPQSCPIHFVNGITRQPAQWYTSHMHHLVARRSIS